MSCCGCDNSVKYFVNLCGQTHTNTTCLGRDGEPIYALACQQGTALDSISGQSFSVGLGDTMAFYNLPDSDKFRQGLLVSIQGGGRCSNNVERTLNITMLCDMSVGAGYPELPPGGIVEPHKCAYQLQWRSQYACPMCTARDMRTITGLAPLYSTSSAPTPLLAYTCGHDVHVCGLSHALSAPCAHAGSLAMLCFRRVFPPKCQRLRAVGA